MILLTGATGFLGAAILNSLDVRNVRVLGRSKPIGFSGEFVEKRIGSGENYLSALDGIDTVIHVAARAHVLDDKISDPLAAYREVNALGTVNLAEQARDCGVKRFIFISSVKVYGESTELGDPFRNGQLLCPQDDYSQSKVEAENGLWDVAKKSKLDVVIIRPPLIYGPGVKANFASMKALAEKNLPLPLGAIRNKRSLVGVDNLVDLILVCIEHPNAANQTFLVSDDCDVSTTELLLELTRAAGKTPCLLPVPMIVIRALAYIVGKKPIADRLCGSLQVDISHTKETLEWNPPVSFKEGIHRSFDKVK